LLLPFGVGVYRWQNGRTQFAPTIGFVIIDLEFSPQQTPPLPKGRGTVEDGGGILEFYQCLKKGNPRRGFPSCTSCNSPILRSWVQRNVSLSAESDQRRCLWNPPPFEKGGPKLYLLVWRFTGGKTDEHTSHKKQKIRRSFCGFFMSYCAVIQILFRIFYSFPLPYSGSALCFRYLVRRPS